MSSSDRLLRKREIHDKLYDVESMMEVKGDLASGFVILLNGSPSVSKAQRRSFGVNSKRNTETEGLALAFMSLTSGNVIDTCFGVQPSSGKGDEETPAHRRVRKAKTLLDECDTTDCFREIAVDAYCEAFEAVVKHNEKMGKLNWFTKCFRSQKIRSETENNIRTAFVSLVMAIRESSR